MPDVRHLTEEERKQFDDRGFLVFPGFFDQAALQAYRDGVDEMEDERGGPFNVAACDIPRLWPIIWDERVMTMVEDILGPGFGFHHLHATRQGEGTGGVFWHQDYMQIPQTNRKRGMVHVFFYFDGLNGEIGDLLVLPGSHRAVADGGALAQFGTEDLPGSVTIDDLPPGSMVIVHSGIFHARRAKPGGGAHRRYFVDSSYCEAGVQWPSNGADWRDILDRLAERHRAEGGSREHLFDHAHFFDIVPAYQQLMAETGSMVLRVNPADSSS